jgi:hypothetical protein
MLRLNLPGAPDARRHAMTSQPIRDAIADHLITRENAALILIDYQPTQLSSRIDRTRPNPPSALGA